MTREIPLSKGKIAIVDDADYAWLSQWKWCFNGKYATRTELTPIPGGFSRRGIRMHRLIMGEPTGLEIDHIDGDKLNNTRANLRIATRSQNAQNMPKRHGHTSQYKGVSSFRGKWTSRIRKNTKFIFLGIFTCELDAARAYNEAALKYHGEFARLNDIS